MHQARDLALQQGFDPKKELAIVWDLKQVRKRQHHEAHIDATKNYGHYMMPEHVGDNYLLGMETVLDQIISLLEHHNGWYCPRCGYLDAEEVTNDERCSLCGFCL